MASNPRAQSLGGGGGALGSNSASTSSMSTMFSHLMSTGSKYMEGVKNLVVGTKVSGLMMVCVCVCVCVFGGRQ